MKILNILRVVIFINIGMAINGFAFYLRLKNPLLLKETILYLESGDISIFLLSPFASILFLIFSCGLFSYFYKKEIRRVGNETKS